MAGIDSEMSAVEKRTDNSTDVTTHRGAMETVTSTQHCFLWDCPQEILDIIFGLAYHVPFDVEFITNQEWMFQKEEKKKVDFEGYEIKPFSGHKVNDFMVSKNFFFLSSKAYFKSARWSLSLSDIHPEDSSDCRRFLKEQKGLFIHFAKRLHMRTLGAFTFRNYSFWNMLGLRELEVSITERQFKEIKARYPWEHALANDELEALTITTELGQLKQIKSFTLTSRPCEYANTTIKQEMFETNVSALEALIKQKMSTAKEPATNAKPVIKSSGQCARLYFNSKVCFKCSKKHYAVCTCKGRPKAGDTKHGKQSEQISKPAEDPIAWIRSPNLPNSKDEIRKVLQAHMEQFVDRLFERKQKYEETLAKAGEH